MGKKSKKWRDKYWAEKRLHDNCEARWVKWTAELLGVSAGWVWDVLWNGHGDVTKTELPEEFRKTLADEHLAEIGLAVSMMQYNTSLRRIGCEEWQSYDERTARYTPAKTSVVEALRALDLMRAHRVSGESHV